MSVKRKHSVVWSHFVEDSDCKAKCKYCKTSISIAGGSHGNLSRHMKTKHPLTPLILERQTSSSDMNADCAEIQHPSTITTSTIILPQPQQNITQSRQHPEIEAGCCRTLEQHV